ncbi:MAG: GNT-I family protein [Bacteroidetes bacterium ADurb.Bin408]|nr:MAG: GNT-I family protein [Bacteroidetes bacterium ADurb.Bin408]
MDTPMPAIIIVAYNRTEPLKRLLDSLLRAKYPAQPIPLIISIDKSESARVADLAEGFHWPYGKKEVVKHNEHKGLLKHLLYMLSLAETYEDLIVLEDDLAVSPYFYSFARQALAFYGSAPDVAGVSLYHYSLSESSLLKFDPLDDSSSVYFMQYPSSWGFAINKKQALAFLESYNSGSLNYFIKEPLFIKNWPAQSWKRFMTSYLIKRDNYFVFPRLSLTTNFSPAGTHIPCNMELFHVPIQTADMLYRFIPFEQSMAVYDSYFEMTPACLNKRTPLFTGYNFELDLQGCKDLTASDAPYVLTTRHTLHPLFSFASEMKPLLLNVVNNEAGKDIFFTLKEHVTENPGKIHYGHAEYLHRYSHKILSGRFSFLKYFYFYILYDLKLFFGKFLK